MELFINFYFNTSNKCTCNMCHVLTMYMLCQKLDISKRVKGLYSGILRNS